MNTSAAATCRFCSDPLEHTFVDLGMSPLCQTQVLPSQLDRMEPFFPLHVQVCGNCFLVQLPEYVAPDIIFGAEYPYYSSYSQGWVRHASDYVGHVMSVHGIGRDSFVVELASNDGYLLQHFVSRGVRCLGIEPAQGVGDAARARGVPTLTRFFGAGTALVVRGSDGPADLIVGNNVLAHVPDLKDFLRGVTLLLADDGMATFEFPHLMRLMEGNQFDTIYHEHFSYFSFTCVRRIFAALGLRIFDVQELGTHGGSLRVYACHAGDGRRPEHERVAALLAREASAGFGELATYSRFGDRVEATKRRLLGFLIQAREEGRQVVGYGAPGKGNTLLNFCGIRTDFLAYTVDRNPHKQGTFTPGTRIPIHAPGRIFETRPDYVLILPWNLAEEISREMEGIRAWGGRFVVPIPAVRTF
ncbi:MAG: class I SAM-dependent methyltransferase [Pseudomonadota bacterium]|nr:MAG: SAM-dependent methyltransferase [Pseudomonadota bacterium]